MLIALHAPMHCGKTTVANMMLKHLDAEIISFASPLKAVAKSMGWNGQKDAKGRRLLQRLGTECGRECIDYDVWVNLWKAKAAESKKRFVIADDCRFVNEAHAVQRVYRILGREKPLSLTQRFKRMLGLNYCHISERPLPAACLAGYIHNYGTLDDLEVQVKALCKELELHG